MQATATPTLTPTPAEAAPTNPYLSGVFRPMAEELELVDLPVTGVIPKALDGRYLRIGPNPVAADPARYHWFLGDGMIHGLAIEQGRALWYRNRWVRSEAVAAKRGVEPAPGPRRGGDTVNTNVVAIGGKTYALVEAGSYPVSLSADLDGQAYDPFGGTLSGGFSAHPHLDPLTGENHAICYQGNRPGQLTHVVIDAGGRVVREEPIALPHGPMIHDCAITARYVLILDLPVAFSMEAAVAGAGFPYRWNPAQPARIGLLPRQGGQDDIIWCAVAPGFAFHVVNAFDRPDGKVELDVCAYHKMFAGPVSGPDGGARGLERWTLDPAARSVAIRTLDPAPQEFPRLDERRVGQPYRYAYAMAVAGDPTGPLVGASRLYRHDLETGARQVHAFGEGRVPGEFVFVPKAPDSPEAAGWLIGFVVDAAAETTDLVILDAERFEDAPQAVVHLPHRVPAGFHGNWIGKGELEARA